MQNFDKEIEELEKEIFGTQEENVEGLEGQETDDESTKIDLTQKVEPEKVVEPKEDWEKRYKGHIS